MADKLSFVDTNVFVYALFEDSEYHATCRNLVETGLIDGEVLCVTSQTVAELFAVITDPRRVSNPYSTAEAIRAISDILRRTHLRLLPQPANHSELCFALLERVPVTGPKIFDHLIAASMIGNDVSRIYSFDTAGFLQFKEIEVLIPGNTDPHTAG